ncbi:MAG: hypothetical protein IPJ76_17635 [Flavobacteriales bacterium]|nr:MAG: hypothetical protein IPJ76_17635 [Flavobacteriales bacterium]
MKRFITLVLVVVSAASLHLRAQSLDRTFYPEELREDLELLRVTIHEAHADPYRYVPKEAIDQAFARLGGSIRMTMPLRDFIDSVNVLLNMLGDGHTRCALPLDEAQRMARTVPLLPLDLAIEDTLLHVRAERMGFRSVAPGSRIHTINGMPAGAIVRELLPLIVVDGKATAARVRRLEREFAVRFVARYGISTEYKLICENPHGVAEEVTLNALTQEEMASATVRQQALLPWRSTWYEERDLMWLELHTLEPADLEAADVRPERFLGDLLKELEKRKVGTLVIDVRGAKGSDLGMAEQVFALVAQHPFKVARRMTVRSVTVPTWYRRAIPLDDFYASVHSTFTMAEAGAFILPETDERMKELPAAHRRFEGRVFVLQDGATRESAAAVGMLVKRHARGKLLGEEGGTNAVSYCGGRELRITAPRTGVRFVVPLIRYTFDGSPSGPSDHGELPDVPVKPSVQALQRGEDSVRNQALEIIGNMP